MTQPTLQKLKYTVVSCSSEEAEYPVQELLTQSPQSKGWQSARFCDFPQEITLQFMSPIRLKQVQFLSHQSKISSKIEIYTYIPDPSQQFAVHDIKYKKLGYLSLDSNEKTGYQARELKSVYIDAPCMYLKLLLHKHHTNKYNLFNQVGIIALSTFGEFLTNNPQTGVQNKQEQFYNEIQYQTQFDQATLDRLRALELAKERALKEEDFEECKRLKEAVDRLKQIAIQLRQLDERKSLAIQNEDYDSAKIIKSEIDRLRNAVAPDHLINRPNMQQQQQMNHGYNDPYMQQQNQQQPPYYEEQMQQPMNQGYPPTNQQQSQYHQPQVEQQNMSRAPYEMQQQQQQQQQQQKQQYQPQYNEQSDDRPLKPAQNQQYNVQQDEEQKNLQYQQRANFSQKENHDEQVIPTIKNKGQHINENEEFQNDNQEQLEAEPLSQQAKKLAEPLIPILGDEICRKIFSKSWQLREEGLKQLEGEIKIPKSINKEDPNSMFIACFGAISHTVGDRITQVCIQSMSALKQLCRSNPSNIQQKADFIGYLENVLSALLEKLGENNQRIQTSAEETLFVLGQVAVIGNQQVTSAISTGSVVKQKFLNSHKHLAARNSILEQFVNKYKIGKDILLSPCAEFAVKSVQHQNRDVRKEAIKLISAMNKQVGEQKLRPFLTGIPLQQMDVIEEVLSGKNVDEALNIEEPNQLAKGNKKPQQQQEEKKQQIQTNINAQGAKGGGGGGENNKKKEQSPPKKQKENEGSKVCQFCGKVNKDFLDNNKLDMHLWKECPLLTTCQRCAQVVEISTLQSHYLEECDNKKQFKKCPRCKEPIHQDQYKKHSEELSCLPAKALAMANRCCLCHQDIPPGQEGWKKHLVVDQCPNNERTIG